MTGDPDAARPADAAGPRGPNEARTGRRPKLSAIVACYGDGPAVPIMYERLTAVFERLGVDHEIVFVNDASPDDAAVQLGRLAEKDPRVVVVTHTRNFGSQSAFSSGMRVATGDAVVLLDGDLQDPPEVIQSFYAKWRDGYEIVYGVRVQRETSRVRELTYKLFYRIFAAVSYVTIPADAGDFSLIDRRAVDALNSLPESNRFVRGLRAWIGFRQTGVPYVRPERLYGRSTNSFVRNLGWARRAILSFSYVPLELITLLALLAVAASFVAIAVQIVLRLSHPGLVPTGFTTLIVLILFVGGIQLLCLGIIGSYLAHIYDEVKRRPPYLVDSILNKPVPRGATGTAPEEPRS